MQGMTPHVMMMKRVNPKTGRVSEVEVVEYDEEGRVRIIENGKVKTLDAQGNVVHEEEWRGGELGRGGLPLLSASPRVSPRKLKIRLP